MSDRAKLWIEPGVYAHYKGKHYRVISHCILDDSIAGVRILGVLYIPLYGDGELTIRTLENFDSDVDGKPRFQFLHG